MEVASYFKFDYRCDWQACVLLLIALQLKVKPVVSLRDSQVVPEDLVVETGHSLVAGTRVVRPSLLIGAVLILEVEVQRVGGVLRVRQHDR